MGRDEDLGINPRHLDMSGVGDVDRQGTGRHAEGIGVVLGPLIALTHHIDDSKETNRLTFRTQRFDAHEIVEFELPSFGDTDPEFERGGHRANPVRPLRC
jgi:hypothetical protein